MDRNEALGAFLKDRRSRVDPGGVGLPTGPRRRVRGLRREEVAMLADLSVDYYARLEQGRQPTASPGVLRAVARALRFNEDELHHLFTLAHVAGEGPAPQPAEAADERVRRVLGLFDDVPAMVVGPFVDIVAANDAATFLFDDFAALPVPERNGLHWMLLDPKARQLYGDAWAESAAEMVGMLRLDAGRAPGSQRLADLIAKLSERSPLFRRLWADQAVSSWLHHRKTLRHPALAGPMEFTNEFLNVGGAPDPAIVVMIPADRERFRKAFQSWQLAGGRGSNLDQPY